MMNSKDPATRRQSGVNRDSLVLFAAQIDLLKEEVEERGPPWVWVRGIKEEGKAGRIESMIWAPGEGISLPHPSRGSLEKKGWPF